jgi:hypothetical protein
MSRQKGTPKTGGRKAGTPNKTTTDIKMWVANILDGGRADFEKRLKKLDDREYIRTFVGLLGYVMPKMAPTTPEDILRKEREMMQELLLSMPEEMIDRVTKRLYELQTKEERK